MLCCPVCKNRIVKTDNTYKCQSGHCFDISRKGYVNLLISNSAHHGDDKPMSRARREFLSGGYYKPLLDAVCDSMVTPRTVLDIGCGECYYLSGIKKRFPECSAVGIDISKTILETAAPRVREYGLVTAVASCKNLPVSDNSIDAALSVFAPFSETEVTRVLKNDGVFVRVMPDTDHLIELKRAVYDTPRPNDKLSFEVEGMRVEDVKQLRYTFTVTGTDMIKNLFTMTPYYYKTSPSDMAKLDACTELTITAHFNIAVYRKC